MDFFEKSFDIYVTRLYGEGKRLVKIRSLTLLLTFIQNLRKVILIQYLALLSCISCSAGLLLCLIYVSIQSKKTGHIPFDEVIFLGLFLFIVGGLVMAWSLREKRWLNAFGLDTHLKATMKKSIQPTLNTDQILHLVDKRMEKNFKKIVEESLHSYFKNAQENQDSPDTNQNPNAS